jgi:transcriptional regulator
VANNPVPTCNYTAVHAYGQIEIIDSGEPLRGLLKQTVQLYEQTMPRPWVFDETGTFAARLLDQIVGFRMVIDRIEGKFKLNQNHPEERRRRVVRTLEGRGDENARGIARLMRDTLPAEE